MRRPPGIVRTGLAYDRAVSGSTRDPEVVSEPGPAGSKPIIRYPTGWLLAVVDDPATAADAAGAVAATGTDPSLVHVLSGADGRAAFRDLGASTSPLARIIRGVQFMSMDQMPDLPTYERAIEEGRTVIAVHPKGRPALLAARDALAAHGAHFQNYFGRFMTEEFSRWRGTEPDLPDYLRR
jgi:hypothetical protein